MTTRRGFTMLEAMVALAIVGLVCVGVLAAYGSALRADATASARLPLAALATERIAAVDLYDGALDHLPDSLARGKFASPFDQATWETNTRRVAQTGRLYDVTVIVHDDASDYTLVTRRAR